jgi:methylglutaconyl-CoA hydratase
MSDYQFLQLEYHAGCATVWLNRPERHNAFHEGLLGELPRCLQLLSNEVAVRAIVLAGRGRSFCAGADLEWMQQQARADYDANLEDARRLAWMLRTLAQSPKPTIARVQGVALGGGMGLVAACDIAIATSVASFGTTEVRLGLVAAEELDGRLGGLVDALRSAGPQAQAHCKRLLASLRGHDPLDPLVLEQTARSIAEVRAGDEAREGIAAFFAKRKPNWTA